jgi:methyl-accepting chemotaxis protein
MIIEKISKSKLFNRVIIKTEIFFYLIVLPLGVYFAYFTGGFAGDSLKYLLIGSAIGSLSVTPTSLIYLYKKISSLVDSLNDAKCNPLDIKLKILRFPLFTSSLFFIRWIIGGSIALIFCAIMTDITAMQAIPFLLILPLMGLINFSIGFFNTENGFEELLSLDKIRDTYLNNTDYKGISFTSRILMLVVPVAAIPAIVLGDLIYLIKNHNFLAKDTSVYITLIALLSVATIVLITYFMTSNIKRTAQALKETLEGIKNGRLDIAGVPMITSSEIGFISQSANSLVTKLRTVIAMVQQSAEVVSGMSANIQEASGALSKAAAEQAAGIEEISSTIEEILATVTQNTENAGQAEKLAENSYQLAEKGNNIMSQTVNTINEIKNSAEKINDIIDIINTITFQTNILSLNAAVEAARAGEHGRTFAVVAGEVRNLAKQSATSSKQIETLIKSSVNQVYEGTRLAQESGNSLKEIFTAISQVRQRVLEISTSSKEQNTGLKQISDAVAQSDETTQQNSSAAEELSATAETLRSNASELMNAVKFFTV